MTDVRIAIIGAGFGGVCVALKLAAAGHRSFTVFDSHADVGGTWWANTYPGAACDAPSHVYSYSFAQTTDWSRRFAPGPEIQRYLRRCVDEAGIGDHLRLGVTVEKVRWTGVEWILALADDTEVAADVVVGATGQLNVPGYPPIPGLDDFEGPSMHTARWRADVDLAGRRVAVVGTGASAVQVIPAIADTVGELVVFQRSAPYVFDKPDTAYGDRLHRAYRAVPALRSVARAGIWWTFEAFGVFFWKWPRLMRPLERVHARALARRGLDDATRTGLTPDHRPGCKRILISSEYHDTFARENVSLVTEAITGCAADGLSTVNTHHDVEVIIYATGFQGAHLGTLTVTGVDGTDLAQSWDDGARAHLGIAVPGFPNLFLVYGPNTNLGTGSITFMLEAQADHIVAAVTRLARTPGTAMEVTTTALDRWRAELGARQATSVWQSGCSSWYLDAHGRDTHNWPGFMTRYASMVRTPRDADYRMVSLPI
ncbi:flavin-containing monooxygenase [Williamsia phyllosphaerae]|uniref:Flavin-binding monooxygenase n=1 Tax=Williamsia phyllosphaerae TaxID=885042 RepID=A0ABQ1U2H6_9NOCA|nr:NAD(P)/FAD-dependent oxidoreductase [Williamsia phyllosphaerae]GGF09540.1 flavin-binding monooxygenase [Williamsia phyllosphaerae]